MCLKRANFCSMLLISSLLMSLLYYRVITLFRRARARVFSSLRFILSTTTCASSESIGRPSLRRLPPYSGFTSAIIGSSFTILALRNSCSF
jgi:hypothetical protein